MQPCVWPGLGSPRGLAKSLPSAESEENESVCCRVWVGFGALDFKVAESASRENDVIILLHPCSVLYGVSGLGAATSISPGLA